MIIFSEWQWMESGLQTAQPINGRGLALLAYLHIENQLLKQIETQCVHRVTHLPPLVPVAL